ncbi:MAG: hypothetical protein R3E60_04940 [Alphaproteobacteria bacterium]
MVTAKGLRLTISEPFDRTGAGRNPLPPALVAELFSGPIGTVATSAREDGGWAVARLDAIQPYDAAGPASAEKKKALLAELQKTIQTDIFTQYNNALVLIHKPEVNRQAVAQALMPVSTQ